MTTRVKCCLVGKLIRGSTPREPYGGLPSQYPSSSPYGGQQVFSINRIICANGLGTMSSSYQWSDGNAPEIRVLGKQLRDFQPCKLGSQRTAAFTVYCTRTNMISLSLSLCLPLFLYLHLYLYMSLHICISISSFKP